MPLAAVCLLASACGGTRSGTQMAGLPEVSGPEGSRPEIAIPEGSPAPTPRMRELSRGSGPSVRSGDVVVAHIEIKEWRTGRRFLNTWDTGQPTTVILDGEHVADTWRWALTGRRAGSRVLLVTPATAGFGPKGMPPAGVPAGETLVEVFDVIGGFRPNAQVSTVAGEYGGGALPRVVVRPGTAPGITVPAARPPAELLVRTLVPGDGPALRAGSTFVANYVGVSWTSGKVVDSSYGRGGPTGFVLGPGTVPPGWQAALTGAREGGRVLLAVPERMGRGFTATRGGIGVPPGHTVVYVLDILAVR